MAAPASRSLRVKRLSSVRPDVQQIPSITTPEIQRYHSLRGGSHDTASFSLASHCSRRQVHMQQTHLRHDFTLSKRTFLVIADLHTQERRRKSLANEVSNILILLPQLPPRFVNTTTTTISVIVTLLCFRSAESSSFAHSHAHNLNRTLSASPLLPTFSRSNSKYYGRRANSRRFACGQRSHCRAHCGAEGVPPEG